MAKTTKQTEQKEGIKLSARKVGKKYLMVIDGEKLSKELNEKEALTLKNKITLFNKKNSDTVLTAIKNLMQGEISKKKEAKKSEVKIKEKAVKKAIKKETKKSSKKVVEGQEEEPEISLVDSVKKAKEAGTLSETERKELLRILQEQEQKEAAEAEKKEEEANRQKTSQTGQRRGEH